MDKPSLRDYITGLLAVGGVVLLCCEAPTLAGQALVAASGLALWGLAAVVWRFGDHLTRLMLQVVRPSRENRHAKACKNRMNRRDTKIYAAEVCEKRLAKALGGIQPMAECGRREL